MVLIPPNQALLWLAELFCCREPGGTPRWRKEGDGGSACSAPRAPRVPHELQGKSEALPTPKEGTDFGLAAATPPQELVLPALQRERSSFHFLSNVLKRPEQLFPAVKNSFLAKEYSPHNLIGGHFQAQILTENKDGFFEPHQLHGLKLSFFSG